MVEEEAVEAAENVQGCCEVGQALFRSVENGKKLNYNCEERLECPVRPRPS